MAGGDAVAGRTVEGTSDLSPRGRVRASPFRLVLGWLVHLYTASGAVFGLLALRAISHEDPREAFFWMIVATIVDSTDGWMARKLVIWELIPRIDGRRLDDVVDYFTYVVVPIVFLDQLGYLPPSPWIVGLPLVASGLGFANQQAKTDDDFFLGFPSYWNVVALYLWLFEFTPQTNAGIVVLLSILVLVPTRYIYPSKTRQLQGFTLVLCALWGLQLLSAFLAPDRTPRWWLWTSVAFPAYYVLASFVLHLRSPKVGRAPAPPGEAVPP